MRFRLLGSLLLAVVALAPTTALAQEEPFSPGGASLNGPPAGALSGAFDTCGNSMMPTVSEAPGPTTTADQMPAVNTGGMPIDPLGAGPTDTTTDMPSQVNISKISGMLVHAEGDLLLLRIPVLPAAGNNNPPNNPVPTWTVVRVPSNCVLSSFSEGEDVTAVGTPTAQGILDAENVLGAE
jgi:hypothetical protein